MNDLTDAHLHFLEEGFPGTYGDLDSLTLSVSCTASPAEWEEQVSLKRPRTVFCFGVHPWNADLWDGRTEERLRDILSNPEHHVGEIGLDAKRGDVASQICAFEGQLRISEVMDRVATVHMVGSEKKVLDCLNRHTPRTVLHAFSNESYVRPFAALGAMFSVNPKILARSEERIVRLLSAIPDDRLLLESDAPHQGGSFTDMEGFAARIAGYKGMETQELTALVRRNTEGLFWTG